MWMVDPALMCDKHLLGEHVECHMLAGSLALERGIDGFVAKGLLEPASLEERHEALAAEMTGRGFDHRSPLPDIDLDRLEPRARECRVDVPASHADLVARCEACRERVSG
jgi:hypothetical protein